MTDEEAEREATHAFNEGVRFERSRQSERLRALESVLQEMIDACDPVAFDRAQNRAIKLLDHPAPIEPEPEPERNGDEVESAEAFLFTLCNRNKDSDECIVYDDGSRLLVEQRDAAVRAATLKEAAAEVSRIMFDGLPIEAHRRGFESAKRKALAVLALLEKP